ncbi:MAG: c-type cytochrome [Ruminococcaceae bacterium]|nr:c-type cytochrome [Oscillospiraceae bacterium]
MKEKNSINRQSLIRILTVLTALLLIVAITVACGSNKKNNKPTDDSDTPGGTDNPDVPGGSGSEGAGGSEVIPGPGGNDKIGNVYRSPSSISVDASGNMFVADATAEAVVKLSAQGKELASRKLSGSVQRVLVKDSRVYALAGELAGELVILDANLNVQKVIEVGHTPSDIVVNGNTAYIANRFDNNVSVVDLSAGKVTSSVDVGREPVAMTLVGKEIYIANHLTSSAASEDVVASTVTVLDTSNNKVKKTITLADGTTGVRGITATADGKYVFATHLVARYTYPTTQLDRSWINSNAFSVINTQNYENYAILLDELEVGAANPWDIAISEDGKTLYVSLSGTHEIMTVNMNKLLEYVDSEVQGGKTIVKDKFDIVNHIEFLSALSGIENRQDRYSLSGNGARDIELIGNKLYVAQYFTGTVDVLDFSESDIKTQTVTIGTHPENTSERTGEMVWYDARFCYQKWESCASCHPDARTDALNWDNINDGLGNPKQTKSMIFSHRTPPVMITGARADAETAVRKGMLFIQFNVLEEELMVAIDDYLRSLLPVESPYLNRDGSLTEAALRGKALFETAGCAKCHPAPLYSDLAFHTSPYLGVDGTWENRDFVTPTLVEIWRSYPWVYNGSVVKMEDIIRKFAPSLKDNEIADLAEFVLSIGIVGEDLGVEQVFGTDKEGNSLTCKVTPGATLNTVTVRCQTKTEKGVNATVTITLYDADKKAIKTQTAETGALAYRQLNKITLADFKVPETIKKGSYLEITITAGGKDIATAYRLNCEVK